MVLLDQGQFVLISMYGYFRNHVVTALLWFTTANFEELLPLIRMM